MNDERMFSTENIIHNLSDAMMDRYLHAFNADEQVSRAESSGEHEIAAEWHDVIDAMHGEAEGIRFALVCLGVPLEQSFKLKDDAFDKAEKKFEAVHGR